jgi:formate hydrogenlyase subunit 6/NADH:ubiquinone oxidoreductase subunit I
MPHLRSLIYLLPELGRTLFTRRATVRYPFAPLELPSCFRGKVTIKPALCTGCGLCVRDCPALALELERENREKFRLIHYRDRCAYCGQCEASCRFEAITLVNEFVGATSRRGALTQVLVERDAQTQHKDET